MTWLTLLLFGLVLDLPESNSSSEPLNARLLEVARSMRGQSIGNGSCTAFVAEALRQAGGTRRGGRGWGEELQPNEELKPGDILSFEDVLMVNERRYPLGGGIKKTYQFPTHVAIVSEIRRARTGMRVSVLHQNAHSNRSRARSPDVVTEWTLNMADHRRGIIKAYRPVRAEALE